MVRVRKSCALLTFPYFLPATIPCWDRYPLVMINGVLFPGRLRGTVVQGRGLGCEGRSKTVKTQVARRPDAARKPGGAGRATVRTRSRRNPGSGAGGDPAGSPASPAEAWRGLLRPGSSLGAAGWQSRLPPGRPPPPPRPGPRQGGRRGGQTHTGPRSTLFRLGSGRGTGLPALRLHQLRDGAKW